MNTPTMLTVEIGFKSYFNRLSLCLLLGGCLLFLFREYRRRLEFSDNVVEYLNLLGVDAVDHLSVVYDDLIDEAADNVFGQFFRKISFQTVKM